MPERVAIIVAMKSEIAPLLRSWKRQRRCVEILRDGRDARATTFRCENITLYCAGIGRLAARKTAEYSITDANPNLLISAGLAGALSSEFSVADVCRPTAVVDAATGQSYATHDSGARGVLVTTDSVTSIEAKRALADRFHAQAVDMEAAAVAQVADAAGVPFLAVKAISDAPDFAMPPLDRFIGPEGKLNLLHLMGWAGLRPRTWRALALLGRNSRKAAEELARELERMLATRDS